MTDPTINARLLDVAKDLDVAADNLGDDLKSIKTDEKKRKFQFSILAFSVVLDLLLSGGFFYALHTTSDSQQKISGTLYANCQSINDEHVRQLQLWNGLLNLPPTPGQPKTPQSTLDEFNKILAKTFTIKDCGNLK